MVDEKKEVEDVDKDEELVTTDNEAEDEDTVEDVSDATDGGTERTESNK